MRNYLEKTLILDVNHPEIQGLVEKMEWKKLSTYDAIGAIYSFVKDEIKFGYNAADNITASQVLRDGYGQCNTKGTLLMALLRAVDIPTRFHGFTIYNELQKGAIPLSVFWLAPAKIIHSWVEVCFDGRWINLEGFILDQQYLSKVQGSFSTICKDFKGYGIATTRFENPGVEWRGEDTYIQSEGIADDFGVYDCPDEFYREKGTNLFGIKKILYKYFVRHLINLNVKNIRKNGVGSE